MDIRQRAEQAKAASFRLARVEEKIKNRALTRMAELLWNNRAAVLAANASDLAAAEAAELPEALQQRLALDEKKLRSITQSIEAVRALHAAFVEDGANELPEES